MSNDFNEVIMVGRLTKDPELKYLASGTAMTKFTIANNEEYKSGGEKKQKVGFFDVVIWNKMAEIFVEYMHRGSKVLVSGRLKQSKYTDQDGKPRTSISISASNVQFLDNKKQGTQSTQHEEVPTEAEANVPEDGVPTEGPKIFEGNEVKF